jgi:hypothetical protein
VIFLEQTSFNKNDIITIKDEKYDLEIKCKINDIYENEMGYVLTLQKT